MRKPTTSEIFVLLYLGVVAIAALFGWSRPARAEGLEIGTSAIEIRLMTCRDVGCDAPRHDACEPRAAREYAFLATHMLGIPPEAPIFAKEQREYIAALCLDEALNR